MIAPVLCAQEKGQYPLEPKIAAASDEGQKAIQGIQLPENWRANLFAAEPFCANIVAFKIDDQGRFYVCETFRQQKGVEDNRGHGHWLNEDLAAQTVEDRLAYIKSHLKEKAIEYTYQDDRIRMLIDTDSDGKADKSEVFSNKYNSIVAGTGAGVVSHKGNVYYTCIPDLWMLKDTDGDMKADVKKSLHTGYGVRFAFRGHDMHGLIVGPDGRLYFSIGDRGYNVVTKDGRLKDPASGAVFRCEMDGSNLEVFATGLRNPQELAFDDYGNLFTGDNNSDSGDKARWVYVVQGGDTGWRMYYQYLNDRGPFNREKVWHKYDVDTPAYVVPPIEHVADGPSGLAYYPGTGLGDEFQNRFFLCDFRGQKSNSGVRTFRVQREGAFYKVVDMEQSLWKLLVTDIDFGPDGNVYVSDWVHGWEGLGKGRIYKINDASADAELKKQVQTLLADGLGKKSLDETVELLSHADRRIRQAAQFELVDRESVELLMKTAANGKELFSRIHSLWGLEQLSRQSKVDSGKLLSLLTKMIADQDVEIRAQAIKIAGEVGAKLPAESLQKLILDEDLRVRYFAAMTAGKLKSPSAANSIFQMLEENDNSDPIVRHGGIMALTLMNDPNVFETAGAHESAPVRLASTIALRKVKSAELTKRLEDADESIVLEAVRAIHDLPIESAFPSLAKLITRPTSNEPILRRVLNANYRLGNAQAIAKFVSQTWAPVDMRLEAIDMLANWAKPKPLDRVLGAWRPIQERDGELAKNALKSELENILGTDQAVVSEMAKVAAKLGVKEVAPKLFELFSNSSNKPSVRADSLVGLGSIGFKDIDKLVKKALGDPSALVRISARKVLGNRKPKQALSILEKVIVDGETSEKQAAFDQLGEMKIGQTKMLMMKSLNQLIDGKIAPPAVLDLVIAAEKSKDKELKALLRKYNASKDRGDALWQHLDSLEGGDASRGKFVFERTELSCRRCHKVDSVGGDVGPDLSKIGSDKDRRYLLESIVKPNAKIAKGFETVILDTIDGISLSGIIKSQDDDSITLIDVEGKTKTIPKDDIEQQATGKSSMPDDLIKNIPPEDLRDLIEYLFSRKK